MRARFGARRRRATQAHGKDVKRDAVTFGLCGDRQLPEDAVGVNPALFFKVEAFAVTDNFTPTKPYTSRIKWADHEGNEQSKLLLTACVAENNGNLRGRYR